MIRPFNSVRERLLRHQGMDSHRSALLRCLSFLSFFLSFPSLLFPFSPSLHPSSRPCSSYFSLLPGARRSVPDGNSLRLQEPPWRPHGGGTGGEQSSPVLPSLSLPLVLSLFHVLFFLPLFFFLFLSFPLSPVFLCLLCIQPARLHRSSG